MENISVLVEKSRGGDRDAFARIVEKYQGMVSAVTLNVSGNYAQSEDLAQETFLTAWQKLSELREPDKLASWFYGIARRVALRWTEQQQRNPLRQATELDAESLTDRQVQDADDDRRQREQSLELVWSTVKELPEIFREPLLLYYRYSKSTADIAESMELTEEAVRQRLSRGRKLLKAEVEKQVESVLEATRPGAAFTIAVVSSLPLAAAMAGCATTTTVSTVAGETFGKGTGIAGTSFAWLLASAYLLVSVLVLGIFGTIIGYKQMLAVIRHSPSIRSRRLVLSNSLWQMTVTFPSLGVGIFLLLPARSPWWSMEACGVGLVVLILVNLFLFWKLENRFVVAWRKTVLEDLTADQPINPAESRRFSVWNLYFPFFAALFIFTLGLTGLVGVVWHLGRAEVFHFGAFNVGVVVFLMSLFAIASLIEYFRQGMKLASAAGLMSDPPPSLDVLDKITDKRDMLDFFLALPRIPDASVKSGFYSEAIMMGALIVLSSLGPISVGLRQSNPWPVYAVVAVSCLGFMVFAKYVAGKPNVRHWGWLAICVFFLVFYALIDGVVLQETFAKYPLIKNQTMYLVMFLAYFGFCFYAVVAVLAGFARWSNAKNNGSDRQ